jgi:hypothetical protein
MATKRMIDFRPRYEDDELDRLARQVAEILAPVFETNGWRWDGEIPSAVDLALVIRRLLATAAENEPGLPSKSRFVLFVRGPHHEPAPHGGVDPGRKVGSGGRHTRTLGAYRDFDGALENEQDIAEIVDPIWVNRTRDNELRVYVEVGVAMPVLDGA